MSRSGLKARYLVAGVMGLAVSPITAAIFIGILFIGGVAAISFAAVLPSTPRQDINRSLSSLVAASHKQSSVVQASTSPVPIEITNNVPSPSLWEELGVPLGSAALAGGLTVLAAYITINGAYRRQELTEKQRELRRRRDETTSAIQDTLTKMSVAWDLWRTLDDQRVRGQMSETDDFIASRAVIGALKDVTVARNGLPTLELEKLTDAFVRATNNAVRNPRPLEDAQLRREVDSAMTRFDDAAQLVLRDAKYGGSNQELTSEIDGDVEASSGR